MKLVHQNMILKNSLSNNNQIEYGYIDKHLFFISTFKFSIKKQNIINAYD